MPELPEVETTLNGIAPFLSQQKLTKLVVRDRRLRWRVPSGLESKVAGQAVRYLERRGKYILIGLERGGLLIHFGMSGSIRVLPEHVSTAPERHDHFDLETSAGRIIRYRDPRRFGCLLWHPQDIRRHLRLQHLGVEPLAQEFDGAILKQAARRRRVPVKTLIMNAGIVVGVGNIYASESLFDAGIHPHRGCHRISGQRYQLLADSIKKILRRAIADGGTTLRDFVRADGSRGYFAQQLLVYGRAGQNCRRCDAVIRKQVMAQRATYFCPECQQ